MVESQEEIIFRYWKEYSAYFKCSNNIKTICKILVRLGYEIPKQGAPIIKKKSLDDRCG